MHLGGGLKLLLLGAALAAASVTAQARVTVSLHRRAEPEGKIVRVRDVALVEGDEPALVERVGAVLLGAAPREGGLRTIGRNHIRTRIFQSGIPLSTVSTGGETLVAVLPPRPSVVPPRPGGSLARSPFPPPGGVEPVIASGDDIVKVIRRHAARELRRAEGALEAELVSLQWINRPPRGDPPAGGEGAGPGTSGQPRPPGRGGAGHGWVVVGRAHGPALGRARYMLSAVRDGDAPPPPLRAAGGRSAGAEPRRGGERVGQALVWAVVSLRRTGLAGRPLERAALTDGKGASEGGAGSLFDRPTAAASPAIPPDTAQLARPTEGRAAGTEPPGRGEAEGEDHVAVVP